MLGIFIFPTLDAFAQTTKTYIGPSNGVWELDNNWSPLEIPKQNDDIVITNTLVNIKSDVTIGPSGSITFDLDGNLRVNNPGSILTIQGTVVMNDGSDDLFAREGTILIDCTGSITLDQGQVIVQGTGSGGIFINHGIITGTLPGGDPNNSLLFNIVVQSGGLVQNGGTLPTSILVQNSGTFETIPSICPNGGNVAIGGKLLPIDTTALLLAGVQTNLGWIILVAISAVGISAFLVKRKF